MLGISSEGIISLKYEGKQDHMQELKEEGIGKEKSVNNTHTHTEGRKGDVRHEETRGVMYAEC